MAGDIADWIGINGEDMRNSRAVKMGQIYTTRDFEDNPVELRGMNEGWDRMRGAILEQAITDYMKALRTLKAYPEEYYEWARKLYNFSFKVTPDLYEYLDKFREIGIEFTIVVRRDAQWYGFNGRNATNELMEAIYEWSKTDSCPDRPKVRVHPNKMSRALKAVWDAHDTKNECERFFWSNWYKQLCRIDPDYLLKLMKEKVEEEDETGTMPKQSKKHKTKKAKGKV